MSSADQMAHPASPAEIAARNTPAAPSEPIQHGARPMTPAEIAAITPETTANENKPSGLPQVSNLRRPFLTGRNVAIATGIGASVLTAAVGAAALYVDANHMRPVPIRQEGQTATPDVALQITDPNTAKPEAQTGDPMLEIQNMLKTNVNEFYSGTISLDNLTFTAIDPEHPNNSQTVDLSQIEELCGVSLPQGAHLDIQLTNALISFNKTDGTMKLETEGMVGGKPVLLEAPWDPKIKIVEKGLFKNTNITGFTEGEPVVSDQDGNPQTGNQIGVVIIDDQPNPAPVEP
jgi:hypothetical protein